MQRKEKELLAMADKLEEEQAEVVKAQKQIKDMAVSSVLVNLQMAVTIRVPRLFQMSVHTKAALASQGLVIKQRT